MDGAATDDRLERARRGDVAAFTALLREHDEAMRAVVWSVVRDAWLMDDVLQEAYEKAYRGLDRFRGQSSFKTWLHRICWTTAIDAVRARARQQAGSFGQEADLVAWPGHGPEQRAVDRLSFREAWDALSTDQRSAIALVLLDGLTHEEAAAVCDTRPGTIAARVSRGRARLSELLGEAGPGLRPVRRRPPPDGVDDPRPEGEQR